MDITQINHHHLALIARRHLATWVSSDGSTHTVCIDPWGLYWDLGGDVWDVTLVSRTMSALIDMVPTLGVELPVWGRS